MSKFNEYRKILEDLKKFESKIPVIVTKMGNIGKNHSLQSFRDQGFTDTSLQKWQPRKGEFSGNIARIRKRGRDSGRAILVKSGALRRSIRERRMGKYAVELVSNLPYANRHNEGIKMPKRQFVGYSSRMSMKIEKMIDREIKSI